MVDALRSQRHVTAAALVACGPGAPGLLTRAAVLLDTAAHFLRRFFKRSSEHVLGTQVPLTEHGIPVAEVGPDVARHAGHHLQREMDRMPARVLVHAPGGRLYVALPAAEVQRDGDIVERPGRPWPARIGRVDSLATRDADALIECLHDILHRRQLAAHADAVTPQLIEIRMPDIILCRAGLEGLLQIRMRTDDARLIRIELEEHGVMVRVVIIAVPDAPDIRDGKVYAVVAIGPSGRNGNLRTALHHGSLLQVPTLVMQELQAMEEVMIAYPCVGIHGWDEARRLPIAERLLGAQAHVLRRQEDTRLVAAYGRPPMHGNVIEFGKEQRRMVRNAGTHAARHPAIMLIGHLRRHVLSTPLNKCES